MCEKLTEKFTHACACARAHTLRSARPPCPAKIWRNFTQSPNVLRSVLPEGPSPPHQPQPRNDCHDFSAAPLGSVLRKGDSGRGTGLSILDSKPRIAPVVTSWKLHGLRHGGKGRPLPRCRLFPAPTSPFLSTQQADQPRPPGCLCLTLLPQAGSSPELPSKMYNAPVEKDSRDGFSPSARTVSCAGQGRRSGVTPSKKRKLPEPRFLA